MVGRHGRGVPCGLIFKGLPNPSEGGANEGDNKKAQLGLRLFYVINSGVQELKGVKWS